MSATPGARDPWRAGSVQMGKVALLRKIEGQEARVAVVGLGYVGSPLAALIHRKGFPVEGIDRFLPSPPPELTGLARFGFHGDFGVVSGCDIVAICVPTPLTENQTPDLTFVEDAVNEIARNFGDVDSRTGLPKLVILESTSYPGTTTEVVKSALENAGLSLGRDFFLAHAPERVDPGQTGHALEDIPRVVGGSDEDSGELAEAFYRKLVGRVHRVSQPEVAEMSKLLENVFRAVNIALVNEISVLCRRMDIDIWEVAEAAATKPFGFMPFKPGPGMGGHCIPVDPFYLAWRAKQYGFYPEFIELAGKINRGMPFHVVNWVAERLNEEGKSVKGARVLVVGVAYKEDVADVRESPALRVIELLAERGAEVFYHDSYVDSLEAGGRDYASVGLSADILEDCDSVVILTAHSDIDRELIASCGVPVIDTRNALGRGGS